MDNCLAFIKKEKREQHNDNNYEGLKSRAFHSENREYEEAAKKLFLELEENENIDENKIINLNFQIFDTIQLIQSAQNDKIDNLKKSENDSFKKENSNENSESDETEQKSIRKARLNNKSSIIISKVNNLQQADQNKENDENDKTDNNSNIKIEPDDVKTPFKCRICGKGFISNNDLKIHTLIHTGEKKGRKSFSDPSTSRRSRTGSKLNESTLKSIENLNSSNQNNKKSKRKLNVDEILDCSCSSSDAPKEPPKKIQPVFAFFHG